MVYVNGYFLSFTKYIVRLRKSRKFREEQERVFVKGLDTIRTIAAAGQKVGSRLPQGEPRYRSWRA